MSEAATTPRKRPPLPVAVAPVGSIAVVPNDDVNIALAPAAFGLSTKACEMKIARGGSTAGLPVRYPEPAQEANLHR